MVAVLILLLAVLVETVVAVEAAALLPTVMVQVAQVALAVY
jgi:hypothetical protein